MTIPLIMLMCVGCGGTAEKDTLPPVSTPPEKAATITEEDLLAKKWTSVNDGKIIMIDLERAFGTDMNMFHFRFCEQKECNDYLFFAVGTFNLKPNNELCFSEVKYWNPPPEGFFIQDNKPFCGTGVLKDGAMTVDFLTTQGKTTLQFTSEILKF